MKMRMNFKEVNPEAFTAMIKLSGFVAKTGLESTLFELINLRSSQINKCHYCIDMHIKEMVKAGATEERISSVSNWKNASCYSDKEKLVLELTEYVTKISEHGVPDELYERMSKVFSEKEFVNLVLAISVINSWNRLAISSEIDIGF